MDTHWNEDKKSIRKMMLNGRSIMNALAFLGNSPAENELSKQIIAFAVKNGYNYVSPSFKNVFQVDSDSDIGLTWLFENEQFTTEEANDLWDIAMQGRNPFPNPPPNPVPNPPLNPFPNLPLNPVPNPNRDVEDDDELPPYEDSSDIDSPLNPVPNPNRDVEDDDELPPDDDYDDDDNDDDEDSDADYGGDSSNGYEAGSEGNSDRTGESSDISLGHQPNETVRETTKRKFDGDNEEGVYYGRKKHKKT